MAIQRGASSRLLIDKEATFGTSPVAASRRAFLMPIANTDLKLTRSMNQSSLLANDRNPKDPWLGNKVSAGKMTVPVDFGVFGHALRMAVASTSLKDEVPATGANNHTNTATLISMSSGTCTVTSGAFLGAAVNDRIVWKRVDGTLGWGIITAVASQTSVTVKDRKTGGSNPPDFTSATVLGVLAPVTAAVLGNITIAAGVATFSQDPSAFLTTGMMVSFYDVSQKQCFIISQITTTTYYVHDGSGHYMPNTTGAQAIDHIQNQPYWKHYFKVKATDTLPSYSIEKGFADLTSAWYEVFTGCKCNQMDLSLGGEGEFLATLALLGANYSSGTTAYDATVANKAIYNGGFEQADMNIVKEAGSSIGYLLSQSLTLNNNLDGDTFCMGGGGVRRALLEGVASVTGKLTALFEENSLLTKGAAATETSLDVTYTSGLNVLRIYMPEVLIAQTSPDISTPGGIRMELDYTAYYNDNALASCLQIEYTCPWMTF